MFSAMVGVVAAMALGQQAQPSGHFGGLGGGGPIGTAHDCAPPTLMGQARRHIDAFWSSRGGRPGYEPRAGVSFPFYPQGGTFFGDLDCSNFVDIDPTPGRLDYACTNYCYDGHSGLDTAIRSFGEQAIGVPAFAALGGTVTFTADGEPDMNTIPSGTLGNVVFMDHGGGVETLYFHLKNGSVAVSPGQVIPAGTQVGLTGSSGNSAGPHLHFTTLLNGQVADPFAGPCRPGPSLWLDQPSRPQGLYFRDMAFSHVDLSTVPGWPHATPRTGQLAVTDDYHWIWVDMQWVPANSTFRFRWVRPDGSLEWETPVYDLGNPEFYGRAWYWFWWWIDGMHSITGTWRVQMDMNGVQMFDAPVEVRPARTPDFNRPPAALQGLAFEPPAPTPTDALVCRLDTSLLYDDLDYDIVRYRYRWTVDGSVVRDVVSAGHADILPAGSLSPGSSVTCEVTPSDGIANGPSSSISYTPPNPCDPDMNQDGNADQDDVAYLINVVGGGDNPTGIDPDFNRDGNADQDDVLALLNVIAGGACP
jgi:hypothetical protein